MLRVFLAGRVVLPAAGAWEIAIKYFIGKLDLPEPAVEFVPSRMAITLTSPLAVEFSHVLQAPRLPIHHRDPFDRLLIAQAQIGKLPIVTSDKHFNSYEVEVIQA